MKVSGEVAHGETEETALTAPAEDAASADASLSERIRAAARVDSALVRALSDQTNTLRLMDRQLTGLVLSQQMAGHIGSIRWLLEHAVLARHRAPLAAELADVEALAAWVCLDLGEVDRAWSHHEAARVAAREAESPALLVHAMVQQAFVLTEVNEVSSAVELVREARVVAGTAVPPLLASWLWAGEGEVLAVAGDHRGSHTAFARASQVLPGHSTDPDLPYIQLDQSHLARWRGNALALLGDVEAFDCLFAALDGPDHPCVREPRCTRTWRTRSPRPATTTKAERNSSKQNTSPNEQGRDDSDDAYAA